LGNRRIGVLAGGNSLEREVSLVSGQHVRKALLKLGYDAVLLRIDSPDDVIPALVGINRAFNVLHGGEGENGTIALLLDVMGVSYPGSKPQACARAMDKPRSKDILTRNSLPTPPGSVYNQAQDIEHFCNVAITKHGFPLVVKPTDQGSSIGVHIVRKESELIKCTKELRAQFGSFLVENYIPGRELTAAILEMDTGEQVLPIVEITPQREFFDYEAKYNKGNALFIVPAKLDKQVSEKVREVSLAAHRAIGCSGYSRVDIRLSNDGTPYVLEVNTNPGMTPMSDLPRAAAAAGIDFTSLVTIMLNVKNTRR
jgi:D-alanine-D-alanine ligase